MKGNIPKNKKKTKDNEEAATNTVLTLIQTKQLSLDNLQLIQQEVNKQIEKFTKKCTSGTYAIKIPFFKVTTFFHNGKSVVDEWCVYKVGRSDNISERFSSYCKYFYKSKFRGRYSPNILIYGPERGDKIKFISAFQETRDLATYVRKNIKVCEDVLFVYESNTDMETFLRENIGLPIGKWKVTRECREVLDTMGLSNNSFQSNGELKSGGWCTWMVHDKKKPDITHNVKSFGVGPKEFILIRKKDAKKVQNRFVQGACGWHKNYKFAKTKEYDIVAHVKLERFKNDTTPLILQKIPQPKQ